MARETRRYFALPTRRESVVLQQHEGFRIVHCGDQGDVLVAVEELSVPLRTWLDSMAVEIDALPQKKVSVVPAVTIPVEVPQQILPPAEDFDEPILLSFSAARAVRSTVSNIRVRSLSTMLQTLAGNEAKGIPKHPVLVEEGDSFPKVFTPNERGEDVAQPSEQGFARIYQQENDSLPGHLRTLPTGIEDVDDTVTDVKKDPTVLAIVKQWRRAEQAHIPRTGASVRDFPSLGDIDCSSADYVPRFSSDTAVFTSLPDVAQKFSTAAIDDLWQKGIAAVFCHDAKQDAIEQQGNVPFLVLRSRDFNVLLPSALVECVKRMGYSLCKYQPIPAAEMAKAHTDTASQQRIPKMSHIDFEPDPWTA